LAVDAYRHLLSKEQELSQKLLCNTENDRLSDLCPQCFGPSQPNPIDAEPDFIVCMDGNFQHRRHILASVELGEMTYGIPSLFLDPHAVENMESHLSISAASTNRQLVCFQSI